MGDVVNPGKLVFDKVSAEIADPAGAEQVVMGDRRCPHDLRLV
jgi:hypothetical protein